MKNKKTFYLLWVLGGLPLFLYPMVLFMGFIFLVALPQWNFSAQARIENILFIITESIAFVYPLIYLLLIQEARSYLKRDEFQTTLRFTLAGLVIALLQVAIYFYLFN